MLVREASRDQKTLKYTKFIFPHKASQDGRNVKASDFATSAQSITWVLALQGAHTSWSGGRSASPPLAARTGESAEFFGQQRSSIRSGSACKSSYIAHGSPCFTCIVMHCRQRVARSPLNFLLFFSFFFLSKFFFHSVNIVIINHISNRFDLKIF